MKFVTEIVMVLFHRDSVEVARKMRQQDDQVKRQVPAHEHALRHADAAIEEVQRLERAVRRGSVSR